MIHHNIGDDQICTEIKDNKGLNNGNNPAVLIIILFMERQTSAFQHIGEFLKEKQLYLVSAESCSGGLLGHLITNVSGSSDYYLGGVISYSNQAKQEFLGVADAVLRDHGAVSRETALEMAHGARQAFRHIQPVENLIALSTSGIAGPGGGSPQKPVGTVWVGISAAYGQEAWLYHFMGTREEIKLQTALKAIALLQAYLAAMQI